MFSSIFEGLLMAVSTIVYACYMSWSRFCSFEASGLTTYRAFLVTTSAMMFYDVFKEAIISWAFIP